LRNRRRLDSRRPLDYRRRHIRDTWQAAVKNGLGRNIAAIGDRREKASPHRPLRPGGRAGLKRIVKTDRLDDRRRLRDRLADIARRRRNRDDLERARFVCPLPGIPGEGRITATRRFSHALRIPIRCVFSSLEWWITDDYIAFVELGARCALTT
jgi:hypothetical protein